MQVLTQNKQILYSIDPAYTVGQSSYTAPFFTHNAAQQKILTTPFDGQSGSENWSASQSVTFEALNYRVLSLRMFVDIQSLEPCPYIIPEITDSDVTAAIKANENNALYPKVNMKLWIDRGGVKHYISNIWLQNRRPGYWLNLMRFFTPNPFLEAESGVSLGFVVQDMGDGNLREMDLITIYGEVQEYFYALDTQLQL